MTVAARFLADHASMLLLGTTAMLFVAVLASALSRSPLHRQRAGELGVAATLVWLGLACLPMPRVAWPARTVPAVSAPAAVTRADARIVAPVEIPRQPPAVTPNETLEAAVQPVPIARPRVLDLPDPVPATPSSSQIDWPPLIARVYLMGVGVCGAWLLLGHVFLYRLVRRATFSAELSERAGARVMVSERLSRPFTCGVFRPIVLIPAAMLRPEARLGLRQVILHEAAHVRRHDGVGNFIFCIALPLLYGHPLYWLLRRQAGLARELIADDQAARADGKAAYAEQLIALARAGAARMPTPVAAIGIFQNRSHFYRRMQMLLERKTSLPVRCSTLGRAAMAAAVVVAVGAATAFLGVRPARAADAPGGANVVRTVSEVPVLSKIPYVGRLFVNTAIVQANPLADEAKPAAGAPRAGSADDADAPRAKAADAGPTLDRLTANQIAITDPMMRDMLAKRDAIRDEMDKLRAFGTDNDRVKFANEQLDRMEERIAEYAKEWREFQKFTATAAATAARAARATGEGSPLGGGATATAGQLDLVNLANTLVDAASAVKLAKARYQALLPLNNRVALGDADMATAKAQVEASAKRLELFRSMAAAALEDAEADLAITKRRWESGIIEQKVMSDATLRVKMLRLIVRSAD